MANPIRTNDTDSYIFLPIQSEHIPNSYHYFAIQRATIPLLIPVADLIFVDRSDTQLTLDGGDDRRTLEESTGEMVQGTLDLGQGDSFAGVESVLFLWDGWRFFLKNIEI